MDTEPHWVLLSPSGSFWDLTDLTNECILLLTYWAAFALSLIIHLIFCDSLRYTTAATSVSKNVVVVVGGLAAGQLGLLVTSSSLAWPGRLDTH